MTHHGEGHGMEDHTWIHGMEDHTWTTGHLTNISRSDGAPEPDGALKVVTRKKIIHYHQLYIDRPDPIAFMVVAVDTSFRIYDDCLRLLFLHAHRESSDLANDKPEESGHFRFLHAACLPNIKRSSGFDFGESFNYEDFHTAWFVI